MRFLPLLLIVLLAACSGIPDEDEAVRVDSYARADAASFKTFRLISGSTLHPQSSLVYQEMAASVLPSLAAAGLTVCLDSDSAPPDLLVLLDWSIPDTQTTTITESVPVIGITGGTNTTYNATGVVDGHHFTGTGSSNTAPTLNIVGSRDRTKTSSLVYGGISLVAYEAKPLLAYLDHLADVEKLDVWSISLTHVSEQHHIDARSAYPEYLRVAIPYIGKSSGGQILLPLAKRYH